MNNVNTKSIDTTCYLWQFFILIIEGLIVHCEVLYYSIIVTLYELHVCKFKIYTN